jgi:hypothetical protein
LLPLRRPAAEAAPKPSRSRPTSIKLDPP